MDPRRIWVAVPTRGRVGVSTFARLEEIREGMMGKATVTILGSFVGREPANAVANVDLAVPGSTLVELRPAGRLTPPASRRRFAVHYDCD